MWFWFRNLLPSIKAFASGPGISVRQTLPFVRSLEFPARGPLAALCGSPSPPFVTGDCGRQSAGNNGPYCEASIRNICGAWRVRWSVRRGSWHWNNGAALQPRGWGWSQSVPAGRPRPCLLKRLWCFFQVGKKSDARKGKAEYKRETKHFLHILNGKEAGNCLVSF